MVSCLEESYCFLFVFTFGVIDGEEHRTHLSKPLGIDRGDSAHVLLGGHHQLVVYDIVRGGTAAIESARRVEEAWHACPEVGVLPYALQLGGLMEVRRADGLAHDVPFRPAGHVIHLLLLHDVQQLRSDLAHLLHRFRVHVMLVAPCRGVLVVLPLLIYMQQRQMIALCDTKVLSFPIAFLFLS